MAEIHNTTLIILGNSEDLVVTQNNIQIITSSKKETEEYDVLAKKYPSKYYIVSDTRFNFETNYINEVITLFNSDNNIHAVYTDIIQKNKYSNLPLLLPTIGPSAAVMVDLPIFVKKEVFLQFNYNLFTNNINKTSALYKIANKLPVFHLCKPLIIYV